MSCDSLNKDTETMPHEPDCPRSQGRNCCGDCRDIAASSGTKSQQLTGGVAKGRTDQEGTQSLERKERGLWKQTLSPLQELCPKLTSNVALGNLLSVTDSVFLFCLMAFETLLPGFILR